MISRIYTIFDSKAQAYLQPFFTHNNELAKRIIQSCVTKEGHPFNVNPGDYTLFGVGTWDDETATTINHATLENLGNLMQFKSKLNEFTENPTEDEYLS